MIEANCDFFTAPTIEEYDGSEAFLNETATTITVLLKPAQAKGAPIRYTKKQTTQQSWSFASKLTEIWVLMNVPDLPY